MKKEVFYKKLCTGCGLCKSINTTPFMKDGNFECPSVRKEDLNLLEKVCPANAINFNESNIENYEPWGKYINFYKGYSLNDDIRYKSASGGLITSILCYLLEHNYVDGVLQVKSNGVLSSELVCNTSATDVIKCSGSLYIDTRPLEKINTYLNNGKKYAFVGKPCDIEALENYEKKVLKGVTNIIYKLTFFCGGSPSVEASKKVIESFGISINDCTSIKYRGNGWPGKTIIQGNEKQYSKEYIDSWNNYFGRDCRYICRFCLNGTGICGDISCGDLWNLENNVPVFKEQAGVNVVFSRSSKGENLLKEMNDNGYIFLEDYSGNIDNLKYIQPYQYNRRISILPKIRALKLFCKPAPKYKMKNIILLNKQNFKRNVKTFLGTCKRIVKGNIK